MHFYKKMNRFKGMKYINVLLVGVVITVIFLGTGCANDPQKEQKKAIKKQEAELYADQTLDRDKGLKMIDTYVNYSKQFPGDTLSAMYLFKASEIAMNLQLGSQSIFYFDKILSVYPDFSKVPECLFLKAFVFENQLGNIERAGFFYQEFLKKYPTHILAKDARASLEYLGKSPEELIRIFEEKNRSK